MSLVKRDSFAREEIHRKVVAGTCDWCGGTNKAGKVYKYRNETDGGRTSELKGKFCSNSCKDCYHAF